LQQWLIIRYREKTAIGKNLKKKLSISSYQQLYLVAVSSLSVLQ